MNRNPASSVGSALAYWSSSPEFEPRSMLNLLICKQGFTAHSLSLSSPIVLIWLKCCWNRHKIASHPSINLHESCHDWLLIRSVILICGVSTYWLDKTNLNSLTLQIDQNNFKYPRERIVSLPCKLTPYSNCHICTVHHNLFAAF